MRFCSDLLSNSISVSSSSIYWIFADRRRDSLSRNNSSWSNTGRRVTNEIPKDLRSRRRRLLQKAKRNKIKEDKAVMNGRSTETSSEGAPTLEISSQEKEELADSVMKDVLMFSNSSSDVFPLTSE